MERELIPDFCFSDDRGQIIQLVHEGYDQINALFSKKGVLRGSHYHKVSSECFFVLTGSVSVKIEENGNKENKEYHAGDFFKVFPYEKHSMFFLEDCWMIQMYDKPIEYADGKKDIFTE